MAIFHISVILLLNEIHVFMYLVGRVINQMERENMSEPYIDIHEAARIEGCHPETLRKRARMKLVPVHYPNGVGRKPMKFLASELAANKERVKQEPEN